MSIRSARNMILIQIIIAVFCFVLYMSVKNTMFIFLMIADLLIACVISNLFDRCPHCNTYQNFPLHHGHHCPKCDQDYSLDDHVSLK